MHSKDPRVQLESLVAAARQGDTRRLRPIVADYLAHRDALLAHTAIQSLVKLRAIETCLALVDDGGQPEYKHIAALRVLQSLHEEKVVEELIKRLDVVGNPQLRRRVITALCRLGNKEGEWKGNSWGTRPDTSGPYYQADEWSMSSQINSVLARELKSASGNTARDLMVDINRNKVRLPKVTETLLSLAKTNDELVPLAIEQIGRERKVHDQARAFLASVARDSLADLGLRSAAARIWLKSGDDDAWLAALHWLNCSQPNTVRIRPSLGSLERSLCEQKSWINTFRNWRRWRVR